MSESAIFKAAVKLAPERRVAYLDQTCGVNADLRREVESLLRAHDASGSFLQDPPARPPATVDDPPITEGPGTVIGPYKLLQQIGEGGMGVVYMAEQQEPVRRKVALKIIKPGMDSRQVIARFEAERQALAMMDHQNITKVLDAGTTDSDRPYFVMELVHGISLTKYCDDNKLTPRQRLELFVPICHAIQHAHQKGIIHRDVKPSNVLVTMYDDRPVPKVIDFGVAKAVEQRLTEKTLFTQFGTLVGTFEYMSPEQAEMNAFGVDTRSDVYSLGVLLYELLTGSTPLERQRLREVAYGEIVRLIKEEEPPRPSTRLSNSVAALAGISQQRGSEPDKLTQLVRGELDWIVMRCLEKDRTRRYETANGLARDVERYLKDEPVEACPPTAGYRLRKFARKNRKLLVTAAAFAVLLLLGVAGSTWQAVRATEAEAVADGNAAQAREKEREANRERDEAQKQRDEVKALNEKLRRTTYAAHMNLAQHAWDAGGVERVRELLEQHRPKGGETDLRGFEWTYFARLCQTMPLTLKGHTHFVWSVAYSPDGKRLASAGGGVGSEVKLWDTQTGQVLLSIKGAGSRVAFSPDGKRLATAGGKRVKVRNAETGKELLSLNGHSDRVRTVAFSPDGTRLASVSDDKTVKLWDAQTGQELLSLKGGDTSVAFSPDGKRLASASPDNEVKVWDAQTGKQLLTFKGHTGWVSSVAFSPDGKRLASASDDKLVKVWDAQTGQELRTLKGHTERVWSVAFSLDGKRLASASEDKLVKVWDAQTGQELHTLKGHTKGAWSVAFSPDGKRLASASLDKTVKVWEPQQNPESVIIKSGRRTTFSPDFSRLASAAADGTVKLWDARTGQETRTLKGHTNNASRLAFSPDGKRLATASRERVKVWDVQTGKELLTFKGHSGPVSSVAFSPDGKRLASAGNTRGEGKPSVAELKVRDAQTPKRRAGPSRKSSWVAELKVWDAQTGRELLTLKGGDNSQIWSVAFSPDGKRLASGGGRLEQGKGLSELKVWDAQTGKELLTLKGNSGFVDSVAFSPDGKRVTCAFPDNTVKVWDVQTGKELLSFKGHTGLVSSVAFSPDGKRLASASRDKTVKVWDAQTAQELLTLIPSAGTGTVNSLAFSPDGHRLAGALAGGTVKIWDATPLPEKR